MDSSFWDTVASIMRVMLLISVVAGIGASLLLFWTYKDIRKLNLPAGLGFFEAMRLIPLRVAMFLDLMDLALDTFAAPLAWLVLRWLRLDALRATATVEALLPGTQYIPTMTLLWGATRLLNLGLPASADPSAAARSQATPDAAPSGIGPAGGVTVIDGRVVRR